jgi:hypothetical protein
VTVREQLQNLMERVFLLPVRLRARARSRHRRGLRAETLATTRRTLERLTELKAESLREVYNVALYLILLDQDLADFTDDLVCAIGERRRAFLAKHEAVLLHEAAEDLTQLLGRDFRAAVETLGASDEQRGKLDEVTSDLNKFWQTHREFLGGIRKTVAAHREKKALVYLQNLEQLKPLAVMERAAELSALLNRLLRAITLVAMGNAGAGAILRDMVASGNRKVPDDKRTKPTNGPAREKPPRT